MSEILNEKTEFSVSMCVYGKDNPEWFKRAVDSILNQTVKPTEVVLVVDGPIPSELDEVVSTYEKMNIFNVIRLEENRGHGEARRIGLENCKYNLVALMDADDVSVETRFENQIKEFENDSQLVVVGGNITEFIGDESNVVSIREVPESDKDIKQYLKKRCPFNQMTVIFKKDVVQSVGGYIDWFCEEDYYLWLRLYLAGAKFKNIQQNLVNVRIGNEMFSRRGGWKYFKSERKLQKYMLKNKIIGIGTYIVNVAKRFVVQVLLPNKIRGWAFKKFARKSVK